VPGLFGCVLLNGKKDIVHLVDAMADACSYHPSRGLWVEDRLHAQGVEVRRWRRNVAGPAPHSTRDGEICVSVDGWILSVDGTICSSPADSASLLIRSYRESGQRFIEGVEGEFNLFLRDEQKKLSILANDRFGLRPCFYAFNADAFCFGFEGKQVVEGLERRPELDPTYAWNYLSYGRAILGGHTFYREVKSLDPASIVILEGGTADVQQYWRIRYRPARISDSFFEELADVFRTAVEKRIFPGVRYGINLSGGLDSRIVAQVLSDMTGKTALAITFGRLESDEIRYAVSVAEVLGLRKRVIELTPADFLTNARFGARFSEAHDLFVQSYGVKVFSSVANEVDVATTGLALDLTLGGSYIDNTLLGSEDHETLDKFLAKRMCYFSTDEVTQLFPDDDRQISESNRQMIADLRNRHRQDTLADTADAIALHARVQRIIFPRQGWQRLYIEDITPTFDYDFIDMVLSIPAAQRLDHRAYMRFLKLISPATLGIPYQRTNLPALVPVEYWEEGVRIEEARERLYRKINQEAGPFISYPRYATNYGDWLRWDKDWLSFVDTALFSSDCRLYDACGMSRSAVREMFEAHVDGRQDNRQKLLQLISLALAIDANL
jgi:asparagine synthetase B (glutamine-hydrolysing)